MTYVGLREVEEQEVGKHYIFWSLTIWSLNVVNVTEIWDR
jgi:hypothetical protein